jgi:four helix bundle protein
MGTWKTFEEIEIWQLARAFCKDIYRIINYEGLNRDYKLRDQINASSGSIMDNIAEGFNRDGTREFVQFLSISKGSAGESRSQLYRIYDRDYISEKEFHELKDKALEISNKTGALIAYLKNSGYSGIKYK